MPHTHSVETHSKHHTISRTKRQKHQPIQCHKLKTQNYFQNCVLDTSDFLTTVQ